MSDKIANDINAICDICHAANIKWWQDPATGEPIERNVGELLMLVTSELGEALEGHRKDLMDKHLPNRKNFEVELADALIRIFDTCAGLGLDVGGALVEKAEVNRVREDHKVENRLKEGGKKY